MTLNDLRDIVWADDSIPDAIWDEMFDSWV